MQNPDIARLFDEVADLLEIQDANPFRVRAYRNAARTIRDFPEPIAERVRSGVKHLTDIPGIGEDLAEKITDIVTTGELPLRKQLAAKLPAGLLDLLRIPGLGPKRVKLLYKKLKVKSAADLAKVLDAGKVQKLKGFGPKIEEKMRAGLGQAQVTERRMLLNEAETPANAIVAHVKAGGGVQQIEVAGSYRRRRETIGHLDILFTSGDGARLMDRFVTYGEVAELISKGETRSTVKLRGGLQVDLRAVEPAAYGAALQYFTGSKGHNVELRQVAQGKKLKLNEYGLFRGTRRIAGETEAEIYEALGLDWIPPELREARGEIALAREHRHHRPLQARDHGARARCETPARAVARDRRVEHGRARLHHPEKRGARHPGNRQARPPRRRARRSRLRRRDDSLRHQSDRATADAPARRRGGASLDRRDRPPHRPPAGQTRALSARLRCPGTRLCRRGVPARDQRAPGAHGPPRHARRRGEAARGAVRVVHRQPPAQQPALHEVRGGSGAAGVARGGRHRKHAPAGGISEGA